MGPDVTAFFTDPDSRDHFDGLMGVHQTMPCSQIVAGPSLIAPRRCTALSLSDVACGLHQNIPRLNG
jgi:hypothetical protein